MTGSGNCARQYPKSNEFIRSVGMFFHIAPTMKIVDAAAGEDYLYAGNFHAFNEQK